MFTGSFSFLFLGLLGDVGRGKAGRGVLGQEFPQERSDPEGWRRELLARSAQAEAVLPEAPAGEPLSTLGLSGIKITLDGDRGTHDLVRIRRGGQGTFDACMKAVRLLLKHGIQLNLGGNFQPGFSQTTTIVPSNDLGLTFNATLANPFPSGVTQPAICSEPFLSAMVSSVTLVPGNESVCGASN